MIREKDVVRLRVPFPDISSDLAVQSHMYICYDNTSGKKQLVKCQTFKLSNILGKNAVSHYVREVPDAFRNPFNRPTLIDCDKLFSVEVTIPVALLTTSRRDVCGPLFASVCDELLADGYSLHEIDVRELKSINHRL